IKKERFHCLLCDIHLDGKDDGIDFMAYLAKNMPEIKRLLMTGRDINENAKRAINVGRVEKIYTKPLNLPEIASDVMNFAKESGIYEEKIEDLSDFHPRQWHISPDDETQPADDAKEFNGDSKTILIVEDSRDMRTMIMQILRKKINYQIILASDGLEGLEKASIHKPDLIIVDWMMPKLTGVDMIERMQRDDVLRTIPTILLTAKSDEESRVIGIQKGAHAYLGKPFNELELVSTVENLIRMKEGEDRVKELNKELTDKILKRFLPHKLVNDIKEGIMSFDDSPKLKDVTILFSDLVGFSEQTEAVGALKISGFLNEYFDKMTRIIFEYGGTVDKFIGDGIMAIFGAPEEQKYDQQIQNALKCAQAMQSTLNEINMVWKPKNIKGFSMRIGIHAGSGIVGSFGGEIRSEYTVIGPVVNMASKINKAAGPGDIFFSASVRDRISSGGWSKAGSFHIKGIGETALFKLNRKNEEDKGIKTA
ncbi:MAG: response regulator, partial [Oligoflexales bacterium]|nr:response regulator [Oligoflexales bacterium]